MTNTLSNQKLITPAGDLSGAPVDFDLDAYHSMGAIEVALSAELGRRWISIDKLMRLRVDDVLLLSRPTGENVDLFVGDVLIGNAELLATDERLAIRVADLLDKPASPLAHDPQSKITPIEAREETISDED